MTCSMSAWQVGSSWFSKGPGPLQEVRSSSVLLGVTLRPVCLVTDVDTIVDVLRLSDLQCLQAELSPWSPCWCCHQAVHSSAVLAFQLRSRMSIQGVLPRCATEVRVLLELAGGCITSRSWDSFLLYHRWSRITSNNWLRYSSPSRLS